MAYWEPRRILYNGALGLVVLGTVAAHWPQSKLQLSIPMALLVFVLAVLANVCYCAAYIPDLFAQSSGFRDLWVRVRWIVLALGIAFAGALAWFFAEALFSPQ